MIKGSRYNERDIIDWRAYERVREGGVYNMFDPRARIMTGLSQERYIFILGNYSTIQDQINEDKLTEGIKSSL